MQTINREVCVKARSESTYSHHRCHRLLHGAAAILAGALLAVTAAAATPAAPTAPAKPTSSCVACHTDVARIQEEAKGLPVPTGSALQVGKG